MQNINLWLSAGFVLVFNIPFGFWRASAKKFKIPWFLAIHVPIPVIITLRYTTGIGWNFVTFPVLIGTFLAGQFLGSQLYIQLRVKSNKRHAIGKYTNSDSIDQ